MRKFKNDKKLSKKLHILEKVQFREKLEFS